MGHHTVSVSQPVLIDITPPEANHDMLQHDKFLQNIETVKFQWQGVFHDPESGKYIFEKNLCHVKYICIKG